MGVVDRLPLRSLDFVTLLYSHAYELTYDQLEELTGIPHTTIWRYCKKHKFRTVSKGTRPLLDDANKAARLKWARDNESSKCARAKDNHIPANSIVTV